MTTVLNTTKEIMADVFEFLLAMVIFSIGVPIAVVLFILMTIVIVPICTIIVAIEKKKPVGALYLKFMCDVLEIVSKRISDVISMIKK